MNTPPPVAAVIDIGSNTIKVIVAERTGTGIQKLFDQTAECRISAGMYTDPPEFTAAAMTSATTAVRSLLEQTTPYAPTQVEIVATSAVRDAHNRDAFAAMLFEQTRIPLKVLSGTDEAAGIARGIAQEPLLSSEIPYTISDLGGGSLEWIYQHEGAIAHLTSMNLGAVRIMTRFLSSPHKPLPTSEKAEIREHCLRVFSENLPPGKLPAETMHWGTGGAFTISRLILAAENRVKLDEQSQTLTLGEIQRIEETLSAMSLEERQVFPGLPPTRADILPVALIIIQALAEFVETETFHHSLCNLRMGRVAALLAG